MKVVDIADELHRELGSPTDLSIPAVAFWLRSNIGALNSLINTYYYIDETNTEGLGDFEIVQKINGDGRTVEKDDSSADKGVTMGDEEKAVLKKMYMVHHYGSKLRSSLGAASTDEVLEVTSDGATVRKINKNELSKTYSFVKRQEVEELNNLVASYKGSKAKPIQVAGDDTVEGFYNVNNIPNRIKYN